MKRQRRFSAQEILLRADLAGESLPKQPIVELCADRRVLIENHGGVIEYGPQRIQVRVKFGAICIEGDQLRLCSMTGPQLVIMGSIDRIGIVRGEK